MLFFTKTYGFDICKKRLGEAILTNTQNAWFIIQPVQKYPIFMLQAGPYQVSV